MKILVTGTRHESEEIGAKVRLELERACELRADIVIVHGGTSGADMYALAWALNAGLEQACYKADWKQLGNAAGPRRNSMMLALEHLPDDKIDLVLAFPALDSKGTWDCIRKAADLGIEVHIYPV